MAKFQSPLLGYNNNVRHKNRVFHVQTEDSGVKHPHIITHLFMDGGRILKSVKKSYAEHVGTEGMSDIVRAMMKEQHKAIFVALRDGQFDHLVDPVAAAKAAATKAAADSAASLAVASERSIALAAPLSEPGVATPLSEPGVATPLSAPGAAPPLSAPGAAPLSAPESAQTDADAAPIKRDEAQAPVVSLPPPEFDSAPTLRVAPRASGATPLAARRQATPPPLAPPPPLASPPSASVPLAPPPSAPTVTTATAALAAAPSAPPSAVAKAAASLSGRSLPLDVNAREGAAKKPSSGASLFHSSELPPPPKALFAREPGTGAYRTLAATPRKESRPATRPDPREEVAHEGQPEELGPGVTIAHREPSPSTRTGRVAPHAARGSTLSPAGRLLPAETRVTSARPAATSGVMHRPTPQPSLFSDDLLSDKSLDEVILSYLADDLDPPRKK